MQGGELLRVPVPQEAGPAPRLLQEAHKGQTRFGHILDLQGEENTSPPPSLISSPADLFIIEMDLCMRTNPHILLISDANSNKFLIRPLHITQLLFHRHVSYTTFLSISFFQQQVCLQYKQKLSNIFIDVHACTTGTGTTQPSGSEHNTPSWSEVLVHL